MSIPLVVANWKMNKRVGESLEYVQELRRRLEGVTGVEVVLAPPYTALAMVAGFLADERFGLAAQDVHWEEEGAYTGAVTARQLTDVGCRYVLLGHSERRRHFGETDAVVASKVQCAIRHGLFPIVCVGEMLEERDQGQTDTVVARQLEAALNGLTPGEVSRCSVAYEPIWAIGTGRTATPRQAADIHRVIRQICQRHLAPLATGVRILYGGSVTVETAEALMEEPEVDGLLVGGASLDAAIFDRIVRVVTEVRSRGCTPSL